MYMAFNVSYQKQEKETKIENQTENFNLKKSNCYLTS